MNQPPKQKASYQRRSKHFRDYLAKLDQRFNQIFYLKIALIFFVLALSAFWAVLGAEKRVYYLGCAATAGGGVFLFILLDIWHRRVIEKRKFAVILVGINDRCGERRAGRWNTFSDDGAEFADGQHPFALDLDLYGQSSLFQWINCANTFLGRRELARWLGSFPPPAAEIRRRQEAVAELAGAVNWRQRFAAYGIAVATRMKDPEPLIQWAQDHNRFFTRQPFIIVIRALAFLTGAAVVLFLGFHLIPYYIPLFLVMLHIVLMRIGRKKRELSLTTAAGYHQDLALYQNLLRAAEFRSFHAPLLQQLQSRLVDPAGDSAGVQLRRLEKIVDAIANRNNAFFALINIITLWDYHCLIALETWKSQAGRQLGSWLETLAQLETMSSLALINYDHPDWALPEIGGDPGRYTAQGLGHPLLTDERRIVNDLSMQPPVQTLLITGSNMSGKSTYLRTAGINLVLAYAGARVCARKFQCSRWRVYSCMRVSDNLEQNISSFFAEILRIKMIVQAASEFPVFFLLDEIFKGTNSLDRHTGAKILIKKLIDQKAVGLVSTHDLELGELVAETAAVTNYHFLEFYENNQLSFDYRLRPGISATRNALHLMKLAGIEVE